MTTALVKATRALLKFIGYGPFSLRRRKDGDTGVSVDPETNVPFETAKERLKQELILREIEYQIAKTSVETRDLGDEMIAGGLQGLVEIQDATNRLKKKVIEAEIIEKTQSEQIAAGVYAAKTIVVQQQQAYEQAQRSLERSTFENQQERLRDAAQHLQSLGPTQEEQRQSEEDMRLSQWALDLADGVPWKAHPLNQRDHPVTDTDRYYAYAAVQYYASMLGGKSQEEAIRIAAAKLVNRRKQKQEISDDEAHQFARHAHKLYGDIKRAAAEAQKAGEVSAQLEASRNNIQAAETHKAATDRLDAILHGRSDDGAHFDPRA